MEDPWQLLALPLQPFNYLIIRHSSGFYFMTSGITLLKAGETFSYRDTSYTMLPEMKPNFCL